MSEADALSRGVWLYLSRKNRGIAEAFALTPTLSTRGRTDDRATPLYSGQSVGFNLIILAFPHNPYATELAHEANAAINRTHAISIKAIGACKQLRLL